MTGLSGAWNFRDVAETAGITPGLLFRSGELSGLDDDGRSSLQQLGIGDVADLRSAIEVDKHGPGLVPGGVQIHLLPFIETVVTDGEAPHEHAFQRLMTEKPSDESTEAAARRYMAEEYRGFAKAAGARLAVHRVITLLGDRRPLLAHCFAGKDRTGFTVGVVLRAAGVERDAVMADYLASNAAAASLRAQIIDRIRARFDGEIPPEMAELTEARLSDDVLGVHEEYLDAAWATIDEQFGSLDAYLTASGVTAEDIDRLRTAISARS
ncbi:phosphotyrosine protein phosphatase [Mycolicibacterium murale]|uniref:Phosphotyrosine protein phosphatase n=1 Tax=Mycolicibacterium murale TaxID=182220 RepID=A0A7I9WIK9_9MYCO|nr:tyrosine-protein phosphatase [Mycolicibacterium murale]MCV7180814.1 tyrosine-protein phosphatase [Mycolicibacterium murale]GFG57037.1 phosphotyrosine protein phosphatase [Mycolicibacterium murale]